MSFSFEHPLKEEDRETNQDAFPTESQFDRVAPFAQPDPRSEQDQKTKTKCEELKEGVESNFVNDFFLYFQTNRLFVCKHSKNDACEGKVNMGIGRSKIDLCIATESNIIGCRHVSGEDCQNYIGGNIQEP